MQSRLDEMSGEELLLLRAFGGEAAASEIERQLDRRALGLTPSCRPRSRPRASGGGGDHRLVA